MLDEILQPRPKKHMRDLNIVPILDMLTTVIFFLLMSTTFIEYNKLTLPPAKTVTSTTVSADTPLTPKLLVTPEGNHAFKLKLVWQGKKPGEVSANAELSEISSSLQAILKKFSETYPTEKTLQVSLQKNIEYQVLISVMDASRETLPDVVLLSYHEANQS